MLFAKRHVILCVFDAQAMGYENTKILEISLQMLDAPILAEVEVYYLKIMTRKDAEVRVFLDEVYQIKFGEDFNQLELLDFGQLNLRSSEGLGKVVRKIRNKWQGHTEYIFITTGHGSGYRMNNMDYKFRFVAGLLQEKDSPPMISGKTEVTLSIEKQNTDNWNNETLWCFELAKAMEEVRPGIAIFNMCYVNLLDSLIAFRNGFTFIVGAEGYQCQLEIDLGHILKIIHANYTKTPEELQSSVYEFVLEDLKKLISQQVVNCENPSLFLINTKHVEYLLTKFNLLAEELMILKDPVLFFKKLQEDMYEHYISTNNWLVDLGYLVSTISNYEVPENVKSICSKILIYLNDGRLIMRKNPIGNNQIRTGITVYLPMKDSVAFHNNAFNDFFNQKNNNITKEIKWYEYLNKIKELITT